MNNNDADYPSVTIIKVAIDVSFKYIVPSISSVLTKIIISLFSERIDTFKTSATPPTTYFLLNSYLIFFTNLSANNASNSLRLPSTIKSFSQRKNKFFSGK